MAATAINSERASIGLLRQMAHSLSAMDARSLASESVAKAKLCLFDYLACAFESRPLPWSQQAIRTACKNSERFDQDAGTIIGTAHQVSPQDAAFANAVLGHGLVRDDMHLGSVSHLGSVVLPAALALAERNTVTGRQLLAAIVTGYEAGGKLGRAILDVEVAKIHRPTGITGPFAAAAAGAKLLCLEQDAFTAALAFAANSAAGYNEWATTGGSEMFFHTGFAARNALTALELAAAGAYASETALDGKAGMLAAFGKSHQSKILMPFQDRAEIMAVFFKEVPACNFAQTAAQAARQIAAKHEIDIEHIDRVHVRVPYAAASYPGCDCAGPFEHILQAKMSIQYNVAAALICHDFEERNYDPHEQLEIVHLAAAVELEIDAALTRAYPGRQGASVTVIDTNGEEYRHDADDVVPADDLTVRARFDAAANESLDNNRAEELADFIDTLEQHSDAGKLVRLTRTTPVP